MRVAIVFHGTTMHGGERSMLELAEHLRQYHEVLTVLPREGPLCRVLDASGLPWTMQTLPWWVHNSTTRVNQLAEWRNGIRDLAGLIGCLKAWKPDIVVTSSSVVPWGAFAAAALRVPHVWCVREFVDDFGLTFDLGAERAFRVMHELSDVVVANSAAVEIHVRRHLGGVDGGVTHVHPAVDVSWDAFPLPPGDVPLRALVLGRVSPEKDQGTALRALAAVTRARRSMILRLVGDARADYAASLLSFASEAGVRDRVELIPEVDDVAPHLRWCHVVVVPSGREAFGRVSVEAFHAGRPVIATASGGSLELVRPGVNGELFGPRDEVQLAARLLRIAEDRSFLERLAAGAAEAAAEHAGNGARFVQLVEETVRATPVAPKRVRLSNV